LPKDQIEATATESKKEGERLADLLLLLPIITSGASKLHK